MMARIGNKLIAICSAAIGIIYAAGYTVTEATSASTLQSQAAIVQPAPTAAPTNTLPTPTGLPQPTDTPAAVQSEQITANPAASQNITIKPTPTKTPAPTAKPAPAESIITPAPTAKPTPQKIVPTPTPTPAPTPVAQNQKYHDGTYSGSGTNRFGTVEVAVTITKGKIAKVDITSSRTRYPQRYIDGLPQEVLNAQDYNIDTVSGATNSSMDFINAVHQALLQAEG
jgi:uncharacterized protein with FMN-binding domain